jgi:uncharacterized protein (TIGR01244 family)
MTYRAITGDYAVAGQITPEDIAALKEAGFTTVINNRPDAEVPPGLSGDRMRDAVEAAGLAYVANPFSHAAFSPDLVDRQGAAIDAAPGPVFAYCASGNRSTVLWAMSRVQAGAVTPSEAVEAAAAQGYDLRGLMPQLEALAQG